LIEAHDALVWQFPVYWFNCPPLLKQWLDEVLTHGWAYGSKGKALAGRKIALAVSLGSPAEDYRADGAVGCSVTEVLRPFELTAKYCNADYRPPFIFHTIDSNAGGRAKRGGLFDMAGCAAASVIPSANESCRAALNTTADTFNANIASGSGSL